MLRPSQPFNQHTGCVRAGKDARPEHWAGGVLACFIMCPEPLAYLNVETGIHQRLGLAFAKREG